jgi:transcriptional regulator with XRE-family HTH domain
MSEEEVSKRLQDLFRSKDAPELTDAEIEAFISTASEVPPGTGERVRAKFVRKVLEKLHPQPIHRVDEPLPFGRWLERERQKARLSREDIAVAVGKDELFIARIETEDILPWQLKPAEAASLIDLFRLEPEALKQLIIVSYAAIEGRKDAEIIASRSREGQLSKKMGGHVKQASDLRQAPNAYPKELSDAINSWLNKINEEVRR